MTRCTRQLTLCAAIICAGTSAPATACDLVFSAGVGWSQNYVSFKRQSDDRLVPEQIPGAVGKLKIGARCAAISAYVEHTSSLETTRDTGAEMLMFEVDLAAAVRNAAH